MTMFMPDQPPTATREEDAATADVGLSADDDETRRKGEKRRAKEERRREKEERRRKRTEAGQAAVDVPVDGAPATGAKKRKNADKNKKSAKHRRPKEE
jgi:hypothetical protein